MPKFDTTALLDGIVAQWRRERPEIDPEPMAVCGDVWRAAERLNRGVTANISPHGLDMAGFDVLMTLRRQGQGKALSPSDLAADMMLSTSAMTNRLDRLQQKGLIERNPDPVDRRALLISLSPEGYQLIESLVASHVQTEEALLSALTTQERHTLRQLLSRIGVDRR